MTRPPSLPGEVAAAVAGVDSPREAMALFVAVVVGLVGVVAVVQGAGKARSIRTAAESYEPVEATVESAGLERSIDDERRTKYFPEVTYSYHWGGEEYTSDTLYPGDRWGTWDESRAQATVDEYDERVGERVTVYVDPGQPDDAYLELPEDGPREAYKVLGFGVVLLVGATAVVLYLLL